MKVTETEVKDVYIIEPQVFGDNRGWFMETWSKAKMEQAGLYYDFVQDNQSYSGQKGTLRGLHFQRSEAAQAKLVHCGRGAVLDVAVDLRIGSPTYKKWVAVELSAENKRQLLIPRGFAHGFLALTDDIEFFYKADNFYAPDSEGAIIWDDTELGVKWGIKNPIMSAKDQKAPKFCDCKANFIYGVGK